MKQKNDKSKHHFYPSKAADWLLKTHKFKQLYQRTPVTPFYNESWYPIFNIFLTFVSYYSLVTFSQVLTKDSVTVAVDAVVYFRIYNATMSITNVENANRSTRLLAQTTLRNVLGTKNLSEILGERESISETMQVNTTAN